jgi:hypothetical protein
MPQTNKRLFTKKKWKWSCEYWKYAVHLAPLDIPVKKGCTWQRNSQRTQHSLHLVTDQAHTSDVYFLAPWHSPLYSNRIPSPRIP